MKRSLRPPPLFLFLLVAAALWYVFQRPSSEAEPGLPAHRAEVLPESVFLNVSASVDFYRERILKNPDVVKNYVELAQVYLQQARYSAGEMRYVPLASELLAEALMRDPSNYHARLVRAALWNTLHQFEAARGLAEELIAEYPDHAYTYGILVDALVELGEYDAALAACDRMLDLRPGLPSYARAAYLRELHGDLGGAIEAMTLAADAGVAGQADRAWALYHLAQLYLGENDLSSAKTIFKGILEERPQYPYAVAGLGHVALLQGDLDEAVALMEEAYERAPGGLFLDLLAEAYRASGDEERLAATHTRIIQGYQDARTIGENVAMEYADYLADQGRDLSLALRLAWQEYERRPGHLHALETYAWALHLNGRSEEAVPYIKQAMRLGTGDAMVFYRAARMYEALGLLEQARAYLNHALKANLNVESPTAAQAARLTLDRLADA
jgi:pentatricopeptide repeat protein